MRSRGDEWQIKEACYLTVKNRFNKWKRGEEMKKFPWCWKGTPLLNRGVVLSSIMLNGGIGIE